MGGNRIGGLLLGAAFGLALGGGAQAQTQEACRAPPPAPPGRLHVFKEAIDEPTRLGFSTAVRLALFSDTPDWPRSEIEKAPSCALDTFAADGATWTLSGGGGATPPRFARAEGRSEYLFLAGAPSLPEAYALFKKGGVGDPTVKKPIFLLTAVSGSSRNVMRVYDGFPSNAALEADMAAALEQRMDQVALYDPRGDAVTVVLDTRSGIQSTLFHPPEAGKSVTLWGPDGHYFSVVEDGASRLLRSGFACPVQLETFDLTDQQIIDGADATLDLACRFFDGDAWISAFVSRYESGPDAAALFAGYRGAAMGDIVKEEPPLVAAGGGDNPDHAVSWIDAKGLGQSLWMTRRGLYYVEVRATYPAEAVDKVAIAVRRLHFGVAKIPADEQPIVPAKEGERRRVEGWGAGPPPLKPG